eukprot:Ihof_evm9s147 gene=Ihof_evmTU9s147
MAKGKRSRPVTVPVTAPVHSKKGAMKYKKSEIEMTPLTPTIAFTALLGGEDYVGAFIAHWESSDPVCLRALQPGSFNQLPRRETLLEKLDEGKMYYGKDIISMKFDVQEKTPLYGLYHGLATQTSIVKAIEEEFEIQFSNLDRRFDDVKSLLETVDGFWQGQGGCDVIMHVMGEACVPCAPSLQAEDVMILQREGEQNVMLYDVSDVISSGVVSTDRGHHTITSFSDFANIEPVLEVTLTPGDILLVPRRLAIYRDTNDCEDGSVDAWIHFSEQISWSDVLDRSLEEARAAFNLDENTRFFSRRMIEQESEEEEEEEEEEGKSETIGQLKLASTAVGKTVNRGIVQEMLSAACQNVAQSLQMIGEEKCQFLRSDFNLEEWMKQYDWEKIVDSNGGLAKISNFLPEDVANKMLETFEGITDDEWAIVTAEEQKTNYATNVAHTFYGTKQFSNSHAILDMFRCVMPDRAAVFTAGKYLEGDFIEKHDDRARKVIGGHVYSRELTLVYYLTKDWKEEYGGGLIDNEAVGGPK